MARSAAMLTLTLLTMSVGGHAASSKSVRVFGDRMTHPKAPKEFVRHFVRLPVEHDSTTIPTAVGTELTLGFIRMAQHLPNPNYVPIPLGPGQLTFNYTSNEYSQNLPKVGRNPFAFVAWGYGHNGHPPAGIYDIPHFDFHYTFAELQHWWEEWSPQNQGPCMGANNDTFHRTFKPIRETCYPDTINNSGDFVWTMGSHLFDFSGPEFNPPRPFNFTQIYGQYDGEIAYYEPMVSQEMMLSRPVGYSFCRELVRNPEAVPVPRLLPGKLCFKKSNTSFTIEYRDFKQAKVGCEGKWTGLYGGEAPLPPGCSVPTAPAP